VWRRSGPESERVAAAISCGEIGLQLEGSKTPGFTRPP
jgi:hypothetical protein